MASSSADCITREVAKDVWTISRPFLRYNFIPFGGRSTAIKLSNGDVWALVSTPLNEAMKAKLGEMGPVKWLIGADAVHHLFLGEFKKAYPDAKIVAVDEAIKEHAAEGLKADGAWGADLPNTKYGFEEDIQHCYFSGYKNKDVAFFHAASKTMITADLIFNLPATEQYSMTGTSAKVPVFGQLSPYTWAHKFLLWTMDVDKQAMKRDVKTVAGWDFNRIIPCHGDVIENDGKKAWMEAYKSYFD
ncbi:hypothetical protein C8Q80DRAFT_1121727 [Daedaleopsis nitida]|nr:hypothetical protein C8Q80DRAFT_1121727 [Daedaleopsis nitida]